MNKYQVIFDLDGTLIDSLQVMKEAWEVVREELSISVGFERYQKLIGLPFPRIISALGLSDQLLNISELYFAETGKRSERVKLISGAAEMIGRLQDSEYSLSIITSKPRFSFEKLDLGPVIGSLPVICGDDFDIGKPNPQLLVHLNRAHHQPSRSVNQIFYVGDALIDLQFAINCGIDFIFVPFGVGISSLVKNDFYKIENFDELSVSTFDQWILNGK